MEACHALGIDHAGGGDPADVFDTAESRNPGLPHNQTAARDTTGVSAIRGDHRLCDFGNRLQLVEEAPVSRMPLGVPGTETACHS